MGQRRRLQEHASVSPPPVREAGAGRADHALTGLSLTILLLALVRCLIPFTANLLWESDPRQSMQAGRFTDDPIEDQTIPVLFFGPTGAAVFDLLSMTAAGFALLLHRKAGGRLRIGSISAAIIGIIFCFIHARSNIENAFHCGSWIGAISLAIAALHLAERPRQRRWFIAALIALAVPLAVDATRFVWLDHAETIEIFKQNEQSFLASRGWTEGSPEHRMYLRRMSFVEPTGAFSFSNILGSIAAALAMLAGGVAIGLWRKRREWRHRWLLPAGVAAVSLWTVYLTHSKGAPVALMMSLLVVALACRGCRGIGHERWRRFVPVAAIALVFAAMFIVIARGMMGPPSSDEGERSLLFRWHYWQAAARIATSDAGHAILGSGPSQFGDDYHWAKNPLNPEEVRSAHNVFIDYIAMLGIGGVILSALLLTWLAQAARQIGEEPPSSAGIEQTGDQTTNSTAAPSLNVAPADMAWTVLFLLFLFGIDYLVRGPAFGTPERFLIWAAGMIGMFFLVAVLPSKNWLDHIGARLGLLGAAALLLIHAQIEMTYFQASSAPIAWLIVAVAGSREQEQEQKQGQTKPTHTKLPLPLLLLLLLPLLLLLLLTLPIAKQQSLLADAEQTLRQRPASWRQFHRTLALLEEAQTIGPFNVKPYEWQSRLAMEAAASLGAQLKGVREEKIRKETGEEIRRLTMISLAAHDRARERGFKSLTLLRQEAQLRLYAAEILSEPAYAQESLALWRRLLTHRPYAWQDRVEIAELLWRIGNRSEAVEHYRQALKLSDALYLEPTRMMPALERLRIEKRIAEE